MKNNFSILEKKLNIKFKNKNLLINCLTHKSYDKINNYEKIEFLGDRVLGLVIAKKLLEIYPDEKEGILDKKFASLVNKKTCLTIARNIGLERYIRTFNPKNLNIKIEDKVVADCCEAFIGALYLDKGYGNVEKFILEHWKKKIEESIITEIDAKTRLQEFSLKKFKKLPIYKLVSNTGPRHKPIFKVAVKLENSKFYVGQGNTKKDAEQMAAILCYNNNLEKI